MNQVLEGEILPGTVAVVAGGSGGINLAIAQHLARAGGRVAVLSRSAERIAAAASTITDEGLDGMGLVADVRNFHAVDEALQAVRQKWGAIGIVISGAAGNFLAPAADLSANGFRTVVEIDLIGTFNVFRAAFPYLERPGASLIAITAPQAVNPAPFQVHACAAKAGVNMLIKCLAMEWGPGGIRVNGISPGPIAGTEGVARLALDGEDQTAIKMRIPLRSFGDRQDIAEVALFLCSEKARYITGSIIDCDGGFTLGDASADALGGMDSQPLPV